MSKEEEAHRRLEKALWRIYLLFAMSQLITMVLLGLFSIIRFYKACHT
jgi:hypothetical protein